MVHRLNPEADGSRLRIETNTVYDTTAILKLIETRWNLAPLGSRDAAANPLSNVFAFSQTR
jgi:hypothetical protein